MFRRSWVQSIIVLAVVPIAFSVSVLCAFPFVIAIYTLLLQLSLQLFLFFVTQYNVDISLLPGAEGDVSVYNTYSRMGHDSYRRVKR